MKIQETIIKLLLVESGCNEITKQNCLNFIDFLFQKFKSSKTFKTIIQNIKYKLEKKNYNFYHFYYEPFNQEFFINLNPLKNLKDILGYKQQFLFDLYKTSSNNKCFFYTNIPTLGLEVKLLPEVILTNPMDRILKTTPNNSLSEVVLGKYFDYEESVKNEELVNTILMLFADNIYFSYEEELHNIILFLRKCYEEKYNKTLNTLFMEFISE